MARYATTQSQYTPYSFDNLWKSSEYLTQQHQVAAANFAQLDAQASPLQVLKNNPLDANEYGVVQNYMQQLKTNADKFQKQGLRGGAFQDFVNLNRNYTTTIKPIETALGQRNAYAAVQSEMKIKDNSIQFTKRPTDIPLTEFMSGKVVPEFISGAQVQQEVGAIASQIAEQLQSTDVKELNKYYLEFQHKYGLNLQEIQQQLTKDPNSALMTIVNQVVSKYPEYAKMSDSGKAAILEYAKQGAYQALGKTIPQVQQSPYLQQQQLNLSISANKREQEKWDMTKKALLEQQDPPRRVDSKQTETLTAQSDDAKELKQKREDILLIQKNLKSPEYRKAFSSANLPKSIRHAILEMPSTMTWDDKLDALLVDVNNEYSTIVKSEYRYDIPSTVKDYDKIINNVFTGNFLNNQVSFVGKTDKKSTLGDIVNGLDMDIVKSKTTITLDPSRDANGLILRIPKKIQGKKVTDWEEVSMPLDQIVPKSLMSSYIDNLQKLDLGRYNPQDWVLDYKELSKDKELVRAAIYQDMVQDVMVNLSPAQTGVQETATTK